MWLIMNEYFQPQEGRKWKSYLTMYSTHFIYGLGMVYTESVNTW